MIIIVYDDSPIYYIQIYIYNMIHTRCFVGILIKIIINNDDDYIEKKK